MAASKLIAPVALALAGVGFVVVMLQRGELSALEERLAGQQASLERLAARPAAATAAVEVAAPVAPTAEVDLSGVETRLSAVEREARSAGILARTLAERPTPSGAPAALDEGEDRGLVSLADEVAALRTDVDALLTGRGLETPEAKLAMRNALAEAREQERSDRAAQRQGQREAWLEAFAAEQHLSADQAARLKAAYSDSFQARISVREAVRNGDKTWEEAREAMRASRDAFDKTLGEVLDSEQRAAFDASQRSQRGGGADGRRGGGGPRGGGAGFGGRGGDGD